MRQTPTRNPLFMHWLFTGIMALLWLSYLLICHLFADSIRLDWGAEQLILLRSILYAVAIVLFPVTNLLRHILLRLDQTMPGDKPAHSRYFSTVVISLSLIESVSLFGLVMFMLGDGFNTLYIFSGLGALGLFLHRPKLAEYTGIIQALAVKETDLQ